MSTNNYTYKGWSIKYSIKNKNWAAFKVDDLTSKPMYLQASTLKEVKENINKAIIMGLNPWLITQEQATRNFALDGNKYYCSITFSDLNSVALTALHSLITKQDIAAGGYLECTYDIVTGDTSYTFNFEYDTVKADKYFQNVRNGSTLRICSNVVRKVCKN